MTSFRRPPSSPGFTLVELVLTLTILAILAVVLGTILYPPVEGYFASARRARLVGDAGMALSLMERDVNAALPNSIRTTSSGGVEAMELLFTLDGARYRDGPGGTYTSPTDILTFNAPSAGFNILGQFQNLTLPLTTTSDALVIYNTGQPGADAYDDTAGPPNVITPPGTTITITAGNPEDHVAIQPPFQFAYPSPSDRVYVVSGPVSWFCDPSAGTLRRYAGYPIQATEPVSATEGTLEADHVSACSFNYSPGTAERNGLLTVTLSLSEDGETVTLVREMQVFNAS